MIVLAKVCAWLKKWWRWIVFPVGIALALLGLRKTKVSVTSPELQGHAKLESDLNARAAQQKEVASEQKAQRLRVADETYDESVAETQRELVENTKKVTNDPVSLNDYLKKAGKNVRNSKR